MPTTARHGPGTEEHCRRCTARAGSQLAPRREREALRCARTPGFVRGILPRGRVSRFSPRGTERCQAADAPGSSATLLPRCVGGWFISPCLSFPDVGLLYRTYCPWVKSAKGH